MWGSEPAAPTPEVEGKAGLFVFSPTPAPSPSLAQEEGGLVEGDTILLIFSSPPAGLLQYTVGIILKSENI